MSTDLITMPVSDMREIAVAVAKSGLFGMTNTEQALALMAIAQAEGRHPAIAARDYHIIQGRASLRAEVILSRFQEAGGTVRWIESTDKKATATFSHPRGGELSITWDMARAAQAQLAGKDNWKKYPAQMLRARCIAEGVRAVYPAALSGFYSTDEVRDMDPPKPPRETTAEVVEPPKQQDAPQPRKPGRPPRAAEPPAPAPREPGEDDNEPHPAAAAITPEMDGVAVAEVLKKMLDQRPPAMEWSAFKTTLAAKYPGHGLVETCDKYRNEIVSDINAGKYDLEI